MTDTSNTMMKPEEESQQQQQQEEDDQTPQDRRFDRLMQVIQTGMDRSRKALNLTELVERSYGEDAAVYGGTEMLVGTMEDMLDKLHFKVLQQDLPLYLKEQQVEAFLDRFDSTIRTLEEEEVQRNLQEQQDKESALKAMNSALLPAGVTLEDVIEYQKYQDALRQKQEMMEALQAMEDEIAELQAQQSETLSEVESKQRILRDRAQELNRSADICSMVQS